MLGAWQVLYTWDNTDSHTVDITRYCNGGITLMLKRNAIGTCTVKLKYRTILLIAQSESISLTDLMVEWFSTITVTQGDGLVFKGVLDAFPELTVNSLDADITLTFQSWLGLLQGVPVVPTQTLTGPLNDILVNQFNTGLDKAKSGRAPLPLSVGSHVDTLDSVTWTVDNYMTLSDFLVQRCDNTQGAKPFDINMTPKGELEIWSKYGTDVSSTLVFQFGNQGNNVESFDYPAWNEYYTDVTLSGAGNGYGAGGNTIVSNAHNDASRKRHYYYCKVAQDSSISVQASLDDAATKYLKYTATPAPTPVITFNANRLGLRTMQHDYGGDIWIGDTVKCVPNGIYSGFVPSTDFLLRINQLDITVDAQGVSTVKMTMIDPTGGSVSVDN